ncbi:UDP-N-acetylmuramate--L-alanine ligase [Flavicella marina]|uniref:UDP-N-acetylmuramate--L-alanine ligase n=1 Tax=Flavicella marina TaxID=1475951 RepID=UPI0012654362|nr:UDP-N-acetylmuramate--L-alanine ligase [Flavicella marina]
MNLNEIHRVYFIGIGGIGMSAIARYFCANGKQVAGYDKVPSDITAALEDLGAEIHFEDTVSLIPEAFKNTENTLVVYTPAVPKDHKQLNFFFDVNITTMKRAQVLGEITRNTFCLGVAGTHGKTTTSAILGYIMKVCNTGATSFLGGITENYNSNLILGEDKVSVVEADEFDRSFLQLSPDLACITSMDADHLDIYGEKEALENSFAEFSQRVSKQLIVCKGLPLEGLTYAVNEEADYQISNVSISNGVYMFSVKTPFSQEDNFEFCLPGKHNLLNALAAIALAEQYGVSLMDIREALKSFKGVKRRFSYKIKEENFVLIDDYAHHPTEIKAVLEAVREMYLDASVTAIFQPHLFSRTNDFVEEFAESLSGFDQVLLLDIYPARELPIPGVTSEWLLDKIDNEHKKLIEKTEVLEEIKNSKSKIFVMIGAGDIGVLIEEVAEELSTKKANS